MRAIDIFIGRYYFNFDFWLLLVQIHLPFLKYVQLKYKDEI